MFLFVLQFILSLFFYQGDCSFSCYLKALFFSILQNKWLCHIIALQKQSKKMENKKKPFQESVHVFPHIQKQPPEVSFLKSIFENFTKFKGKYLPWTLFFNTVAGFTLTTSMKRWLWHKYFLRILRNFKENLFYIKHFRWLLLQFSKQLFRNM